MPFGIRFGSSTTAADTTGPASGPRPASSQPATGQTPRLISARSRRKLGGATAITPFGSFDGAGLACDLSRIMRGIVLRLVGLRNRELGAMPVIHAPIVVPAKAGTHKHRRLSSGEFASARGRHLQYH